MDNEQYLKDLAEKQKLQKQTELDQARARATTELEQQQAKIMPTFQQAKQQTNVQSQLGAKNLAEFWARRGQTSGGISSQAELSRQNVLNRELGAIGQQERDTATQFSQQQTMIGQDYENRLSQARQGIDLDLAGNLYNERLRQQQIAEQRRQQAIQQVRDTKPADGSFRVINGMPQIVSNGKWQDIKYAKPGTKTEKFNRQGYQLTTATTPLTFTNSKGQTENYKYWVKEGVPFAIVNDYPIYVGEDVNATLQSISSAVSSKAISETKANRLAEQLGITKTKQPTKAGATFGFTGGF